MNERIIYQNNDGGVSVIIPATECGMTIKEIAAKDVPFGKPYKIINADDIPSDRTFRSAWEAEISDPDGYGIGHELWFQQKAQQEADHKAAEQEQLVADTKETQETEQ